MGLPMLQSHSSIHSAGIGLRASIFAPGAVNALAIALTAALMGIMLLPHLIEQVK